MMHLKLFIISLLAFTSLLISCSDHPCSKADLSYRLIGFSDADADTIILRRFEKNSLVVKDSFIFDPANAIRFARFGDTLNMVAYPGNALMASDHDYQVFFPGAARTISVTAITEDQSYGHYKKTQCVNEIKSVKVDGLPGEFFFSNGIYLKK